MLHQISVGVCLKALYYYNLDVSLQFVEWIERLKLIGVSKVFLYKSGIHPNLLKVIEFYKAEKFIQVLDFQYPSGYTDFAPLVWHWTRTKRKEYFAIQNIHHTDCIFRLKQEYNYGIILDIDELPVLLKHSNLSQFIKER